MDAWTNPYCEIGVAAEGRVLRLAWTDASNAMAGSDYRSAVVALAAMAFRTGIRRLLIDERRQRLGHAPELEAWRRRAVAPLYDDAGVERIAVVRSNGRDRAPGSAPGRGVERYEERGFDDETRAIEWLLE